MDVIDGSAFDFPNGLNVVGKLHIPQGKENLIPRATK
jgi:hypothetical protein